MIAKFNAKDSVSRYDDKTIIITRDCTRFWFTLTSHRALFGATKDLTKTLH